jgi:hypothetical protein
MHTNVTGDSFAAKDFSLNERRDSVVPLVLLLLSRRYVWSGTATELLSALENIAPEQPAILPESSQALYSHLASHVESLRSSGVDIVLGATVPRVLSLRICPPASLSTTSLGTDEHTLSGASAGIQSRGDMSDVDKDDDPARNRRPLENNAEAGESAPTDLGRQKTIASAILSITKLREQVGGSWALDDQPECRISSTDFGETDAAAPVRRSPVNRSRLTRFPREGGSEPEHLPIFDNVAEAYLGICDMERQVRCHSDANSILRIVAEQIQHISCADTVAVGLNQNGQVKSPALVGVAMRDCDVDQLLTLVNPGGEPILLQLENAPADTEVGDLCFAIGIKSVLVAPFLVAEELWGSIALLFRQRRHFEKADLLVIESAGDVLRGAMKDLHEAS